MYKELGDVDINGAVSQRFREMAGPHGARLSTIQTLNRATLQASECRPGHVTEMHNFKFLVITKMPMHAKRLRSTHQAKRPMTSVR